MYKSMVGIVKEVSMMSWPNFERPYMVKFQYGTEMTNPNGDKETLFQTVFMKEPPEVGSEVRMTLKIGE